MPGCHARRRKGGREGGRKGGREEGREGGREMTQTRWKKEGVECLIRLSCMSVCMAWYVIIVVITSMSFPVCVSINTVHCTVVTVCHSLSHESVRAVEPYEHATEGGRKRARGREEGGR